MKINPIGDSGSILPTQGSPVTKKSNSASLGENAIQSVKNARTEKPQSPSKPISRKAGTLDEGPDVDSMVDSVKSRNTVKTFSKPREEMTAEEKKEEDDLLESHRFFLKSETGKPQSEVAKPPVDTKEKTLQDKIKQQLGDLD